MVIFLDASLVNLNFATNQQAFWGLNTVLSSYMRGNHYVLGEKNVLSALEISAGVPENCASVLRNIRHNLPTTTQLLDAIELRINVVGTSQSFKKDATQNHWNIPITEFARLSSDPTVLICEDVTDADMYSHAAAHYALSVRMSTLRRNHLSIGGGGGSTPLQYKRLIDRRTAFVLCVTDSDRESPADSAGGITRQRCEKHAKDTDWVTKHHAGCFRELENIIPLGLLERVLTDIQQESLRFNQKIEKDAQIEVLGYGDIKKGTPLQAIAKYPKGHPNRLHWSTAVKTSISNGQADQDCWNAKGCTKLGACTCKVFDAIGENVANGVLKYLNESTHHKSFEAVKTSANKKEWLETGRLVFEWCCAPTPQFT